MYIYINLYLTYINVAGVSISLFSAIMKLTYTNDAKIELVYYLIFSSLLKIPNV
jgi:hypothetical protein